MMTRKSIIVTGMVLGLVLAISGCGAEKRIEESTTTSSAPAADLTSPPKGVEWRDVRGLWVPHSSQSGPKATTGAGGAHTYEHSPQGAALAAIGTSMRISVASDQAWPEIVSRSVASGLGRDEWMIARAQVSITGLDDNVKPAIEGYEIVDYSDQEAMIDVYSSYPDKSMTKTTMMVVWVDSDWKYVLPTDAAIDNPVTEVKSLPSSAVKLRKGGKYD